MTDSRRAFLQTVSAGLAGAAVTAAAPLSAAGARQASSPAATAFPRPTRDAISLAMYSLKEEFRYTGYWGIESSFRRPAAAGAAAPAAAPVLTPLQIQREEWSAVRWTANAIRKVVLKQPAV